MSDDKRQTAIRRIQKLLNLAGSTHENEAALAMKLARRLMMENAVTEAEALANREVQQVAQFEFQFPARWKWQRDLANAVAKHCSCHFYHYTTNGRGILGNKGVFVGYKSDAEISEYLFFALCYQIKTLTDEYAKTLRDQGYDSGHQYKSRIPFANSATWRVNVRLREMAAEVDQEIDSDTTALVCQRRSQVAEWVSDNLNLTNSKASKRCGSAAGRAAGDRVNIAKAIAGSSASNTKRIGG